MAYGSRSAGGRAHRNLLFWHPSGHRLLTPVGDACTHLDPADMKSCYELVLDSILEPLEPRGRRLGFEPEARAKAARRPDLRCFEFESPYHDRTYAEGRKIHGQDGPRERYGIVRYGLGGR